MRDVGVERGLEASNLARRPLPLPRDSICSSASSSPDDDEEGAGRFEEGRGPFLPPRSSMGHEAAGAAAAFPPTACSPAAVCFPMMVTESSVSVGLVDGENERVSPVTE